MAENRKTVITSFIDLGFSIVIQTNLKEVHIFDITLNLQNGTYRTYKRTNKKLLYIHSSSNHPRQNASNSYQIPFLKDCQKALLNKTFLIQEKLNPKMH